MKKRNASFGSYQYSLQQDALDAIAAKVGVVAFRPNYHGGEGDKNTVLFYTKEDALYNLEVDRQEIHYSRSEAADLGHSVDSRYVFRDHIMSYENTDPNGTLDLRYANFCRIDLTDPNWERILEGHLRYALSKKRQNDYILSAGGLTNIREADQTFNDMNRDQLEALRMIHRCLFVGHVNYHGVERVALLSGEKAVLEEIDNGQSIQNFGCDFAVPTRDAQLEDLIISWNKQDGLPLRYSLVQDISSRITALGGLKLVWF